MDICHVIGTLVNKDIFLQARQPPEKKLACHVTRAPLSMLAGALVT
jgi:hypothetical protein